MNQITSISRIVNVKTRLFEGSVEVADAGVYEGGALALRIFDAERGDPLWTLTYNVPEAELGTNEIVVKDWAENEGIVEALVKGGILEHTGREVPAGAYMAKVMRLVTDNCVVLGD